MTSHLERSLRAFPSLLLIAAFALIPASGVGAADERIPLQPLLLPDAPVPGVPGATSTTAAVSLNSSGQFAVSGSANIPNVGLRPAVWGPDGNGGLRLLALLTYGSVIPGIDPSVLLDVGIFQPVINDAGAVGLGGSYDAYAVDAEGNAFELWKQGDPVPGHPNATFYRVAESSPYQHLNPSGEMAAALYLHLFGNTEEDPVVGLFVPDGPAALRLEFIEGDAAPGIPGATFWAFNHDHLSLDAAGGVAFLAYLEIAGDVDYSNDTGIWASDGQGGYELIAREGDPSPEPGVSYGDVLGPYGNAGGDLVFRGGATGYKATSSGVEVIARPGDVAPGTDGHTFTGASPLAITTDGRALVSAGLAPFGSNFNYGYWRQALNGELELVFLYPGPPPAGEPDRDLETLTSLQMNGVGEMLFSGYLEVLPGDVGTPTVVYAVDKALEVYEVVRTGDVLEVAPGDERTVRFLAVPSAETARYGPRSLNDSGVFVVRAFFEDDSSATFIGEIPEPTAEVPAIGGWGYATLLLGLGAAGAAVALRRAGGRVRVAD